MMLKLASRLATEDKMNNKEVILLIILPSERLAAPHSSGQGRQDQVSSSGVKDNCLNNKESSPSNHTCSSEVKCHHNGPQKDQIENTNNREEERYLVEIHLPHHLLEHNFVDGTPSSWNQSSE